MTLRAVFLALGLCVLFGCEEKKPPAPVESTPAPKPKPPIRVDGSSTVHPISEGVLSLYASRLITDVELQFSGTGGGFKRFCRGATDINSASRPISPTEVELCQKSGVSYMELPVAFDGVVVVVPKENRFLRELTVAELKKLWAPESQGVLKSWKNLRSTFPDEPILLFGPGVDSGTFDFFTSAILGEAGSSRADFEASEDDEKLAQGIAQSSSGLGYFGLSHYLRNRDRLRAIGIDDGIDDNGKGPIEPSLTTVQEGSYQPLSRPLFLYVSKASAERPEVVDFVHFYLRSARLVAPDVGSVGLGGDLLDLSTQRFDRRETGTVFADLRDVIGLSLADLYQAETVAVQARAAAP